ncbi:MAG: hypothetical protein ACI39W_10915 [Brotaphodocola sp.]
MSGSFKQVDPEKLIDDCQTYYMHFNVLAELSPEKYVDMVLANSHVKEASSWLDSKVFCVETYSCEN